MKQKYMKFLLSLALFLCAVTANAYDFKIDGIFYDINSNGTSVSVTREKWDYNYKSYSGSVVIPSTVIYNNYEYNVTSINNAFQYCSGLTSVTIPNSVTSIIGDTGLFWGCYSLTSIIVDEGNQYYDSRNNCNAIIETSSNKLIAGCKNTIIPNSVTSIGNCAISGCTALTSITIPNSVTTIGEGAFDHCSNLTSITIPNSVTSIGNYAFANCSNLTSITIPNSVTSIGSEAFSGCSGLTSVTINSNEIVSKTYTSSRNFGTIFGNQVKEYIIGNDVTDIGNYTFYGCKKLISVTIGNSVTSIGDYAFSSCTALTSVIIPGSVTSIGSSAFNGTPWYNNQPDGLVYIGKTAYKYKGTMPDGTEIAIKDGTLEIAGLAFYNCSGLTSVIIPSSVTSIGNRAFYNCSGLTSVIIPSSVTSIGSETFYGCSGLTSVTINSNEIVSKTYTSSSNIGTIFGNQMQELIIGNDVTMIGSYAFSGCSGLTSVTIGNNVTNISIYAFYGCSGLTSIVVGKDNANYDSRNSCNAIIETSSNTLISGCKNTVIPESVTSIGNRAFYNCSDLTSVIIPSSVTSIGSEAFYGCSGLTSVTINSNEIVSKTYTSSSNIGTIFGNQMQELIIGNDVTMIGSYAFYCRSGLTSVTIGNNVTSIGSYAFYGCSGLTSIVVGKDNANYDSRNSCNAIIKTSSNTLISGCKNTVIPESVTSIASHAFRNCSDLTSVIIPSSVTSIGSDAFYGCSGLTSVTINSNEIVSKTYTSSSNLRTIFGSQVKEYVIGNDVTRVGSYAFFGCSQLTSITIPNSVTNIGNYAFDGTAWYSNQPDGLVYIGGVAYKYKGTMPDGTGIAIKEGTSSISYQAFSNCSGLTSITIPNSMKSIGSKAFYGCSGLTSVIIPSSVTSIGSEAFSGCSGLTSVTINSNEIVSKAYTSSSNLGTIFDSQVKEYILGNDVTRIGSYAFYNCSGLTSVIIPSSVTSIGSEAFYGCSGLTSVTINSNEIVSKTTWKGNLGTIFGSQIKEYIIGNDVTGIGTYAFYGCSGLTSITIYDGVTDIGDGAFYNCSSLTSFTIPNSVTNIGDHAFDGTAWYNNQPDGLVYAGKVAYIYKGAMPDGTEIAIKEGTLSINNRAFSGCSGLTSVTIPNSVTSIGTSAFSVCTSLTSITIPNSVITIGEWSFCNCPNLEDIKVEAGNSVYDSRNSCKAIIETATNTLVQGCKYTTVPNDIVEIGTGAFWGMGSNMHISIPAFVSVIRQDAFGEYERLSLSFVGSMPPEIEGKAFDDLSKVYATVPRGCSSAYSSFGFAEVKENAEEFPLITINLTEAGTLQDKMIDLDETDIRRLKLSGPINSSDISYLRSSSRLTNLRYLDISGVTLVADNNSYSSSSKANNIFYLSDKEFMETENRNSGLGYIITINRYYSNSLAGAFMGMKIENIILPDNLTRIGAFCFADCTELLEITIPDKVTVIETAAFSGCSSLCKAIIPSAVKRIASEAFYGCTSLYDVGRLDNIRSIGTYSFHNCKSLLYIGSLSNVECFEKKSYYETSYAFAGCSSLIGDQLTQSLDLSNLSEIPAHVFQDCSNLQNVVFSHNLRTIGASAFENCVRLTSIDLPDGTESVLASAFKGCIQLREVKYTKSLLHVDYTTFSGTPFCNGLECDGGIRYMNHIALERLDKTVPNSLSFREGTLSISDNFMKSAYEYSGGYCKGLLLPSSLLRVGNYAFKGVLDISTLSIPENLQEIGDYAFANSKSISQVTLPESLTYVGDGAFYGCDGLVRVVYNANSISSNTIAYTQHSGTPKGIFEGAGIEKVTIGAKVRVLPYGIFKGCEKLIKVEFAERTADDYLYIGPYSFYSCSSLASIALPEATDSIGDHAFELCKALTNIIIPGSLSKIEQYSFGQCPWIESYCNGQPDGVVYLGLVAYTYKGTMPKGTTITLREGTKSIAYWAFAGKGNMIKITLPNSLEYIGEYAFSSCEGLTSIDIPSSVTSIGSHAFGGCEGLTSITVPNSVTSIGESAFTMCRNLESIIIGCNVACIEERAFAGCESIKEVTVLRTNPTEYNCIGRVFTKVSEYLGGTYYPHLESATLHVLEGCTEAYEACYPWNLFGNIVEDAVTSIQSPTIDMPAAGENGNVKSASIYNLQGQRIAHPQSGQVVIVRYSDGASRKIYLK